MSSPRLRVQFETLFEHFHGEDADTQLDDVTNILCCTRRNARIVLNKLEEEGWIEWHPAAGRGKLSQLLFKRSRADVSENLARRYLDEGKVSQALSVLDQDASKLTQVIQSYLGVQHSHGLPVIRLPYYRPLSMLNPLKSMRRSERHIVRQVFNGLTRLDDDENVQPDLAHHWEAITPEHWRFYLRPGVRFHNGTLLTTDIVQDSLRHLRSFHLFAHIERISSPSEWVVDIQLAHADHYLPLWLSETCANIVLPEEQRQDDFDIYPVGTGPYKVVMNDDKRLILQAYDGYFGYRPLLDRVEVWVISEVHSSLVFPSIDIPSQLGQRMYSKEDVDLDPGCMYLLLNRHNGLAKSDDWAQYFSHRLRALNVMRLMPESSIIDMGLVPAHGLKPGWHHQLPANAECVLPSKARVKIAYQANHPMFPTLANVLKSILATDGVTVEFVKYETESELLLDVDIWLQSTGIANRRDEALAAWLLDDSHIQQLSSPKVFAKWVGQIDAWRCDPQREFPGRELGQSLLSHYQIVPMFHCWLGVSKDQCGALQNAKSNALGWFDFSRVWVKPERS
ncbi:SgrR family transcriptional regulator [Vibrio zhugei]|uniref:SgrR family transcriptional regulator n=1 Tax=Vibrio zhugei TaxID=2479546 RepID=A0ABV7CE64_9VIBR|nr:SgrR family transcriptional regulator [Vibrio zhugei]